MTQNGSVPKGNDEGEVQVRTLFMLAAYFQSINVLCGVRILAFSFVIIAARSAAGTSGIGWPGPCCATDSSQRTPVYLDGCEHTDRNNGRCG